MDSLAELIYTAGFFQAISCLQKCGKISGQAGGFAGNIDNMIHPVGEDFRQCFGMNTVSGRIQNDHIRFLSQIIQYLQYVTCNKSAVCQIVKCCVFSCCFYSFLHNLDSDHFICYRSGKLGDGSGSAIEVKDYLIFGISNILPYNRIQNLSCQGVWLKEGKGADFKA